MAWMWYRILIVKKCDRCGKEIPDTQIYLHMGQGVELHNTFCKDCIDSLKKYLDMFWDYKSRTTREKTGDADMYKYKELIQSIPDPPIITNYNTEEPKHEGRKPTNIFSKLFYMMFFEKVE
jgi:hypothetical protein